MATIIGNIAAGIGLISVVTALIYVNKMNRPVRGLMWIGISYIALVIAYITLQFR